MFEDIIDRIPLIFVGRQTEILRFENIWKTILELVRQEKWKAGLSDPDSEEIIKRFYDVTDYKMECHEICEKRFNSIDEHTEFIKTGGCEKLINVLAQT